MIEGNLFVGAAAEQGGGEPFNAIAAATGMPIEPIFRGATMAQLDRACGLSDEAAPLFVDIELERRAALLERIADNILAVGDALIERAMAETGLPRARLEGERGRTVGQLRLFAQVVRNRDFLGIRIDPALPDRQPLPRPDLRLRNVPLGPVAVFGASNFPLAFSVAGGDTASALAAGCPVVVKAHPAHPGTSEIVGRAVRDAVAQLGLHEGVFSLVHDGGHTIGAALVGDPRIAAVGFTGSRRGGVALMALAQARAVPIPVFAEMSSINPVILLPHALDEDAEGIAARFAAALAMGAGQFCTNPGLLLALDAPALDRFVAAAGTNIVKTSPAPMLTPGIARAYSQGVAAVGGHAGVSQIARGVAGSDLECRAAMFATTANTFLASPELSHEMFGAAALLVRCRDVTQLIAVIDHLEGQLTAAIHLSDDDHDMARTLIPRLERKVGRIVVNGFGTGVEVAHAMVHGGPFPATSDGRSTSVGSLAIARFLRPVCYQDFPIDLCPSELQDH